MLAWQARGQSRCNIAIDNRKPISYSTYIMKRYTIVYSYVHRRATMSYTTSHYDLVETDNLKELISLEKYDGCVNFIFEGWVTEAGN